MKQLSLQFTKEKTIQIVESHLPPLEAGQVLVRTLVSGISPGTEMLVYRGQFPENIVQDEVIPALQGSFAYPFKYGYSLVGEVCDLGRGVPASWLGKKVFAFWPHENYFCAPPEQLIPLPAELPLEEAVFLPNMETAVNFMLDARPLLGERVAVFGQGIVGLLTTALLADFPLEKLVTLDLYPLRRKASLDLGAAASLDPTGNETVAHALEILGGDADLCLELSGSPAALDKAIALAGYRGRVLIGSWYGKKRASLDLGGHFHRARIELRGSQVSTLDPSLTGRWDKTRRLAAAFAMLGRIKPRQFITHRFDFLDAEQAYALIDHSPEKTIQVVFTYSE